MYQPDIALGHLERARRLELAADRKRLFHDPCRADMFVVCKALAEAGWRCHRVGNSVESPAMEQLEIRPATDEDVPDVLALYVESGLDEATDWPLDQARAVLARMRQYPDYAVYVACRAGQIVGTYALLIMDNLAHRGAPSAIVEGVAVPLRLHRQGIGQRMMRAAMEHARSRGCYKLALSSNLVREQAHELYLRLGFVQHGLSFVADLSG